MQFVANEPHTKQRKYINALVTAYLIEFEQHFEKTKNGCPNKTNIQSSKRVGEGEWVAEWL